MPGKPPNLFPHLEKAQHLLNPDQKQPAHLEVCRKFRIPELAAGHPTWEEPRSPWTGMKTAAPPSWGQDILGLPFSQCLLPPAVSSEVKEEPVWTLQPRTRDTSPVNLKNLAWGTWQLMLRTHLCYFQLTRSFFFFSENTLKSVHPGTLVICFWLHVRS